VRRVDDDLIRRNISDARRLKRRALRELDRADLGPWQRTVWRRELATAQRLCVEFQLLLGEG
jgi:hypothetical protein